jgi:RNAse (barnase) inhibitor barstar
VYAAPRLLGPLRAAARRAGVAWLDLDLAGVRDRDAFLRRCSEVFPLPDYFGDNWDALHECMLDFAGSGVPGVVVHWRRGQELARRAPAAAGTGLEILRDAASYWGSSGRVFLVVVDRGGAPGHALRPLR